LFSILNPLRSTTTQTGLAVTTFLDRANYSTNFGVHPELIRSVRLRRTLRIPSCPLARESRFGRFVNGTFFNTWHFLGVEAPLPPLNGGSRVGWRQQGLISIYLSFPT
jgi:hypothetical protein